ncbi:GVQW3 protein, partial [Acromyrmex charruanus]
MDQRICIKFCVKNKIKCADAFRMLTVAYGEATLDRSNVYRWYKMFSEGQEDVNDGERAGRRFAYSFLRLQGRDYIFRDFVHISNALIWGTILGYISFSFHQVNDRLHVLYSDLFENNAECRRKNRSILVCQRITKAEQRKQYIWIIM